MPTAHDSFTPAQIVRPTPSVQIIHDVTAQPGVATPEGLYGPLLMGAAIHTRFIEFPSGLYCIEHSLPVESMLYTVRGDWVLSTQGTRTVMRDRSLVHLPANTPKGFEVPFDRPALLLVLRGDVAEHEELWHYLLNEMRPMLQERIASGHLVFELARLPDDHPARVFAAQVNPERWGN